MKNKISILISIVCLSYCCYLVCCYNYKISRLQALIASDSLKVWDWDIDDLCEEGNYPCKGTIFYRKGTYSVFRYYKSKEGTFKKHLTEPWDCMPNDRVWHIISDSILLIDNDSCRLLHLSQDSFVYSKSFTSNRRSSIIKYLKSKSK